MVVWFLAAFLSSSCSLNFKEQLVLIGLLGVSLILYRIALVGIHQIFGKSLANVPNCPARNRSEINQRILMGLTPVIVCALYCCFALPLLGSLLPPSLYRCAELSLFFNICWTGAQMIPIPPFEGWSLTDGIFELFMGYKGFSASLLFSSLAGAICLVCLIYLPLLSSLPQVVSATLFSMLSLSALSRWRQERIKLSVDFDEELQKQLNHFKYRIYKTCVRGPVCELNALRMDIEAIQRDLPEQSQSFLNTCYLLALAHNLRGCHQTAFESLYLVAEHLRGESLKLLHELAYKRKAFALVCQLAKSVYQSSPEPQIAVINGLAYAHCQKISLSQNWLMCAKHGGYETWHLLKDPLFCSWNSKQLAKLKEH